MWGSKRAESNGAAHTFEMADEKLLLSFRKANNFFTPSSYTIKGRKAGTLRYTHVSPHRSNVLSRPACLRNCTIHSK